MSREEGRSVSRVDHVLLRVVSGGQSVDGVKGKMALVRRRNEMLGRNGGVIEKSCGCCRCLWRPRAGSASRPPVHGDA